MKSWRDYQKLSYHLDQYINNLKRMKQEDMKINAINDIYNYFINNKIKVVKMNHCLNDASFTHYEGYI